MTGTKLAAWYAPTYLAQDKSTDLMKTKNNLSNMKLPINFRLLAERAENRELRQRRIDKGVLAPVFGSVKLSPRRGFLARVWAAR
jgi:hypothetical protein